MRILALDASTKVASVALVEDGRLVYEANLISGQTHSGKLMPMVAEAFEISGWRPADIDVYGVVEGPGSFTDLRIGIATVKGLADAADRPVTGVGTLDVLAMNIPFFPGRTVPILDARRGEVYTAVFRWETDQLVRETEDMALPLDELLDLIVPQTDRALFLGDGVPVLRSKIEARMGSGAVFAPEGTMLQRASSAAMLVWKRSAAGQVLPAADLKPRYVRDSNAQKAAWIK